jgi:uncharacterized protein YjbJ (UPF0337 family)
MTKPLTRTPQKIYHYDDGAKVDGAHDRITGNVTDLQGNVTDLQGDVTDLQGDVTNLWGCVSGLRGDVDEIPDSARPCDISDWIEE